MKKVLILLLAVLFINCSSEDDGCNCEKETWRYETRVVFLSNGLPVTRHERVTVSRVQVPCQDEQGQVRINDSDYFTISCD